VPRNIQLYEIAFIHKSASLVFDKATINNERLEFLGDSVYDAIVSDILFSRYPGKDEGFLSKLRAKLVNREFLNELAHDIGLNRFVISHTPLANGQKNIMGNVFEALIGALYLDKGYKKTKAFILKKILPAYVDIKKIERTETDYKSLMIEWSQKKHVEIVYNTVEISNGPTIPEFASKIIMGEKMLAEGTGNSKKEAEQDASKKAYYQVNTKPGKPGYGPNKHST
jgi:ribonuclease-3